MEEAHVGVIVYCKNNESSIENSIKSVLIQTVLPEAVCVIDNASTDGSWDKICGIFGAKVASFEFKANINGVDVIGLQNEFEDEVFTSFRDGISILWNKVNWFSFLKGSASFLAEKINHSVEYMEDENFHHIYGDFVRCTEDGSQVREYYTTYWTPHPDVGFFRKGVFEKINLSEINSFDSLNEVIRQNFLVAHIPEALTLCRVQNKNGLVPI